MKIDPIYRKENLRVERLNQKKKREGKSFQEHLEEKLNSKKEEFQKQINKSILDILV